MFKIWSESNPDALKELKPDLGLRSLDILSEDEKDIMWQHLKDILSIYKDELNNIFMIEEYVFDTRVYSSIKNLQNHSKYNNYSPKFLYNPSLDTARSEFYRIFSNEAENVVLQLLSIFFRDLVSESSDHVINEIKSKLSEPEFIEWRWGVFNHISKKLNELFDDFGLKYILTAQGFAFKQDDKITNEIYAPVLKILSDEKWKDVNHHLYETFTYYHNKKYDAAITHSISSLEAFLQILVHGKTGTGKISDLIKTAQLQKLIPDDNFTKSIFKNMDSFFARERMEGSIAHPTQIDPTEKNSRLLLNEPVANLTSKKI